MILARMVSTSMVSAGMVSAGMVSAGMVSAGMVLAGIAACLASSVPARAEGADCTGIPALTDNPHVEAATVKGTGGKTFFVKSGLDDKSCPAAMAACRRKAFILAGDRILVSGRAGSFVCATFVTGKGNETSGWLPADAVAVESPGAPPMARDWTGTWTREEATIKVKTGAKDTLVIDGDATYGAADPDRVKRGAVNMGSIAATIAPVGDHLAFAMGYGDATLPVDKGDDTTCKVWMRRVGAYLLVDDDNSCGGFNVTFRGTYARR